MNENVYDQYDPVTRKRYRMFGNSREWEPEIIIGGICIPESKADAVRAELRRQKEEMRKKEDEAERKPKGRCPFKKSPRSSANACNSGCAMFRDGNCNIRRVFDQSEVVIVDTADKWCPIRSSGCSSDCTLYDNGCVIR